MLLATGMTIVHGVLGQGTTETFLVNIGLPNKVAFSSVRVTKGILHGADVLIGMDIITAGDFAITHHGGNTCFTFRIPSSKRIDFVEERDAAKIDNPPVQKVGRNDKCPCGSGKKYKKCHGMV